jgi:hypothetical protein
MRSRPAQASSIPGVRILVPLAMFAAAIALIWWRGPDWHLVRDTFTVVRVEQEPLGNGV